MYDVIVVGGGPGGSSAAYHLARAGLKTLLLEKERMPRYKPCGGGLTKKVRHALDFDFSSAIEQEITHASVGYGTARLGIDYSEPIAWCVMRPQFDQLLTERAAGAGAEVRDGVGVSGLAFEPDRVRVIAGSETLQARLVVGADGVNGIVRRAAGFPAHTRYAAAVEAELKVSPAALREWRATIHADYAAIPWGYAWIFPKAEHLSVGLGSVVRPGAAPDLRAALARYVASEPSLAGSEVILRRGYRIPLGGQQGRYHAARVVLVGDAAGLVDPFTAEGIYYALQSGQIAAEEIGRGIKLGRFSLDNHTRRVNREINSDFRYGWLLTRAFFRAPRFAYHVFSRSEGTRRAVAQLVSGESSYPRVIWAGIQGWLS